jgi:hypothetical protein
MNEYLIAGFVFFVIPMFIFSIREMFEKVDTTNDPFDGFN